MQRHFFSIALALAAIGMLAASADLASAQGGRRGGRGGGRGFGGFGFGGRVTHQLDLAALSDVETELKLTDEQKTKVADLADEFRDERRDLGGGGGGGGFSPEAMAERAKLNADYAAKLNEALDETQRNRLQGIYIQVNGTPVLSDEAIAMALKLTDDQKEKLNDVRREQGQATREAFQDLQGADREEITAKMEELNKARDEAYLAVLSDEQKKQFEDMKGEAFEVDMSQLRGRGFGGRGGRDNGA